MKKEIGIYLHIPFCESKCYYCDFASYSNKEEFVAPYIDALCQEILQQAELLSECTITTIYFGGGTPSYIESQYIVKIMELLKLFHLSSNVEVTIEINPSSITKQKLEDYAACGINRVSIGLQSTHNEVLKNIGRVHTYEKFLETLKMTMDVGFSNISVDLIYPLPGLTVSDFKESLQHIIVLSQSYPIRHVSIYNLEVHENTKLDFLLKEKFLSLPEEEEEYAMRENLIAELTKAGFEAYEISNYAKSGFESRHNINYWKQGCYLGFGLAAASFFGGSRYQNTSKLKHYIDGIHNGNCTIVEKEDLDKLALMKEYILLRLRLSEGVNITEFSRHFSVSIFDLFSKELEYLTNNLLILKKENNLVLTKRGKEVANLVWEKFI